MMRIKNIDDSIIHSMIINDFDYYYYYYYQNDELKMMNAQILNADSNHFIIKQMKQMFDRWRHKPDNHKMANRMASMNNNNNNNNNNTVINLYNEINNSDINISSNHNDDLFNNHRQHSINTIHNNFDIKYDDQSIYHCNLSNSKHFSRQSSRSSSSSSLISILSLLLSSTTILKSLILSILMLLSISTSFVDCRHYIAPGPCTWTHIMSNNRDNRFKSLNNENLNIPSTSTESTNDFDISLHCSIPVLTPFTLNISLIDSQHTKQLSINCFNPNLNRNFDTNTNNDNNVDHDHQTLNQQLYNAQIFQFDDPQTSINRQSIFPQSLRSSLSYQRSTLYNHNGQNRQPQQIFEHLNQLQSLQIDSCLFDRIPSDTFRGLSSLKNLTIRRASLNRNNDDNNNNDESLIIESNSFRYVESTIENLDLSQNYIETLPNDLFCPFLTLHTLNLSYNYLNNLASFGLIDPATGRLCLQELYHLDLSSNRLEFVPETSGVAALKNLQHLNLSSNHISEITELAFSALRRLNVLDLSSNRLRILPARMFRDSDELRELYLSNNGLIELPVGLFQGLSKLQILNIGHNQITSDTLTIETFADLIRVIVLNLSNNNLKHLPSGMFQNQYSLQILSLENNQLETIDDNVFSTLYNLHKLNLSGNRFRHLPASILSGLFVIQDLLLSNNQLEHIQEDAFKNCSNLQNLDLSSNRLTTIPVALHSLNKLKRLNLSGNKFTTWIDSSSLIASKLISIDLSDNYLVNITRHALRPIAKTLKKLYLNGNRLRTLDKDLFIDVRQSLRVLRLDYNELIDMKSLSKYASIEQLEYLQILNISYNQIKIFDYSMLPSNLIVLDISGNQIETLGQFNKINNEQQQQQQHIEKESNLEQLDCNNNHITELTSQSLPNSIRILNIRYNNIKKIDQFTFVAKHNITFVDLRNNSLRRIDNNAFRLGVQRPSTNHYNHHQQSILSIDLNNDNDDDINAANIIYNNNNLPAPIFLISNNPYYCDCTMEWLQRVNQLVGGITGSGTISTYPKIGDLDLIECELPFSRQSLSINFISNNNKTAMSNDSKTPTTTTNSNQYIRLLNANSSNFLCRYRSHCFALCHCCEFDACDCEMMCPENCTCYYDQTWNTNIVDCSGGRYNQVPLRIPMDVTSLYLDGNHLQTLNAHTFIGRKNLRILHLNNSMIETITNRSFNGLVYLEELHLEFNQLTGLYGYEFDSLHYLNVLNLHHNRITFIDERTFQSLRSLQSLRIDHNYLQQFGQWFSMNIDSALSSLSPSSTSLINQHQHHILHHHRHHQNKLLLRIDNNPWSCQCSSLSIMYETLWQLRQRIQIIDYQQVRCQPNGSTLFVGGSANHLIDKCNLTRQYYLMLNTPPTSSSASMTTTKAPSSTIESSFGPIKPLIDQSSSSSMAHQDHYPATARPPTPPAPPLQSTSTQSPHQPIYPQNNFDSIYHHQSSRPMNPSTINNNNNKNDNTRIHVISPMMPNTNNNNDNDDENDPDLIYQPIDLLGGLRPKLLPTNNDNNNNNNNTGYWPSGSHFSIPSSSSSSSSSSSISFNSKSWFWMILMPTILLILCTFIILTVRYKQDIQLWFYGRYGIRLFESGLCFGTGDSASGSSGSGSIGSSRSRRRAGRNGFNDNYVRDSEKLFDAFVIYAKQDESFVAQQLAAELECGYPPYRLCLRYRDLPAPTNVDSLSTSPGSGTIAVLSTKDHGYAFDAVTQAIECSRRTLVVISEQFLQSEWCKFELKAAHQETLTSCKTHRLIVVVVPSHIQQQHNQQQPLVASSITSPSLTSTPITNNNANNNSTAKQAESLLQRLDSETKTCIRGVTILTWQERRFWEKLRFAMPANSTIGGGSGGSTGGGSSSGVIGSMSGALGSFTFGTANNSTTGRHQSNVHIPVVDSLKGRTSTVVVTNCGYPTLAASSLSSSSSLARSSVLYDTTTLSNNQQQQQIYQHHYHYAQLPPSITNQTSQTDRSIINQSTMSLHKLNKTTNQTNINNNNNNSEQGSMSKNAFNNSNVTKPLPPPPNQPLPPLPLVNNNNNNSIIQSATSTTTLTSSTYNSIIQSPLLHSQQSQQQHYHQQSSIDSQQQQHQQSMNQAPPPYVEYTNQQQQQQQQQQQLIHNSSSNDANDLHLNNHQTMLNLHARSSQHSQQNSQQQQPQSYFMTHRSRAPL